MPFFNGRGLTGLLFMAHPVSAYFCVERVGILTYPQVRIAVFYFHPDFLSLVFLRFAVASACPSAARKRRFKGEGRVSCLSPGLAA